MIVITVFLLELALSAVFHWKDQNQIAVQSMPGPYLYYLQDDSEFNQPLGLKTAYTPSKNADYRIILLGGSVARSAGNPDSGLAQCLENELNTLNTNTFEVVNAGVSGFVHQQEFLLYQNYMANWQADYILTVTGFNDAHTTRINSDSLLVPHHYNRQFKPNINQQNRFITLFKSTFRVINRFQQTQNDDNLELKERQIEHFNRIEESFSALCQIDSCQYQAVLQPLNQSINNRYADFYAAVLDRNSNILNTSNWVDATHFTDECHFNYRGNQQYAKRLAPIILNDLNP